MNIGLKRYCHIIVGLNTGGAERMLVRLLSNGADGQQHLVLSVKHGGEQADQMRKLGIDVCIVGINPWGMYQAIKRFQPDVFIGWMYYGNLIAAFWGWLYRQPVIWNIRHSITDLAIEKRLLRLAIRTGALISGLPKRIVYNSAAASYQHKTLGYQHHLASVLPNGVDISYFSPSQSARAGIRKELGISPETLVIGHLARMHPMKGHMNFLRTAKYIHDDNPNAQFVLGGRGVDSNNSQLVDEIDRLGIGHQVKLLGERNDVAYFLNGLDLLILSSAWGEAFPNVLIEAMSCAVPVISTDVGDAASIVNDTTRVVPVSDPIALARSALKVLALGDDERASIGDNGRHRVVECYDINKIKQEYHSIWCAVVDSKD